MFSKILTTEVCANVHDSVPEVFKRLVAKVDDEDDILAIVAHANEAERAWEARDLSDVKLFSKTTSADKITFDCADNALVKNIPECIGDKPQGFSVSRRPYLSGNLGPNFVDGTKLNIFSENLNTTISNAREVSRIVDEHADLAMRALISARAEKQEDTTKLHEMFSLINDEALRRASESKLKYYARQLRALGCEFKLFCQTWNTETGKAMFSVPVLHCQLFFAVSFPEALFAAFEASEFKTRVICHGLTVYADLLKKNVAAMLADGYKRAFVCVQSIAMCKKDGEQEQQPAPEPAADVPATPEKTVAVAPPAVIRKGVRVDWPSENVQRRLDMNEEPSDEPAVLRMGTCVDSLIADEKIEDLDEEPDEPEPKRARTASVPAPPCKAASAPQQRRGLNDSARSLTF
jgi:hypothetical protein